MFRQKLRTARLFDTIQRYCRPLWLHAASLSRADQIFSHTLPVEKDMLYKLARWKRGGVAVEIGSAFGASSCFIAAGIGRGGRLYCVDRWNIDYVEEDGGIRNYIYEPNGRLIEFRWINNDTEVIREEKGHYSGECPAWSKFLGNTEAFRPPIVPIREESSVAARRFDSRIDFLFVDAWHEYDQVLCDTKSWLPKLRSDAIVSYHDYGWAEGVRRVVEDLIAPRAVESGALSNLYWARMG
jgi:hypothetical protein